MEGKIREINDKEKQSYNGALLAENRGDTLSQSDTDMSREAYYQARETYQILGDTVKLRLVKPISRLKRWNIIEVL